MHIDENNDKFGTILLYLGLLFLIESLIQFDEICKNFPNLNMFRILSITFATSSD